MKNREQIKLRLTRNWNFPGKERLMRLLVPGKLIGQAYFDGITFMEDEDISIYASTNSYVEWKLLSSGNYEKELGKVMSFCIKEGDTVMDVGANIGIQSLRMSKLVGQGGSVISCEPFTHIRERLQKNIALNRIENIRVINKALSDTSQKLKVNIDPAMWNLGASTLRSQSQNTGPTEIELIKGDELLTNLNIKRLDFIKIDVEGFEFKVLKGLEESIDRYKPRIVFEYDAHYQGDVSHSFSDFYHFFHQKSYELYNVNAFGLSKIFSPSESISSNVLAMPSVTVSY